MTVIIILPLYQNHRSINGTAQNLTSLSSIQGMAAYPSSLGSFGTSKCLAKRECDIILNANYLITQSSDDFQNLNSELALAGFNSSGLLPNWSTHSALSGGLGHG